MITKLIPLPFRRLGEAVLDLVYPPHCTFCHAATRSAREVICGECLKSAVPIKAPACKLCCVPFFGNVELPTKPGAAPAGTLKIPFMTCPACLDKPPHYSGAFVPFLSRGIVRETIHRFKYQQQLHFQQTLGDWLARVLDDPRLVMTPPHAIVPVPLHPTRQRERGFNQAALLAGHLSRKSGVRTLNALKRSRYTPSQTQFTREKRMENLRNAFELRQSVDVRNLHLLLVDDVLTTGSTVNACAHALRKAGAASVRVATVARG